jgi:hypothetical protein
VTATTRPRRRLAAVPDPTVTDTQRGFAQCRADGHEWRHIPNVTRVGDTIERVSTCADCGTRRRSYYPLSGATPSRRYDYPDGYASRGEHALSRVQWRRIMIIGMT